MLIYLEIINILFGSVVFYYVICITKQRKIIIMKVTKNTELVKVEIVLIYSDSCNYQKWKVTEVHEEGFEAIDDDGFEDYFEFNSLQNGWEFK